MAASFTVSALLPRQSIGGRSAAQFWLARSGRRLNGTTLLPVQQPSPVWWLRGPIFRADPFIGTLESFGVYAVGFLARPIGAAIFGHYGDRLGRKAALIATLLLMGSATFLVALVPGYEHIGIWVAIVLTVLRFIHGLRYAHLGSGTTRSFGIDCCLADGFQREVAFALGEVPAARSGLRGH
jgi:MFS family permease